MTTIYTTRKLEKSILDYISKDQIGETNFLGEWTASLFYVNRKRCWLLINKTTNYLLVLPAIKKSDLNSITHLFKETLYAQLKNDDIYCTYELIEKLIGEVKLFETNNDRSANGSLTSCLLYFDDWKQEYTNFENIPFRDLNSRLNSLPNKMLNWLSPKEKMASLIDIEKLS